MAFGCTEPVYEDRPKYDTWYTYTIDEAVRVHWVTEQGSALGGTPIPYWPNAPVQPGQWTETGSQSYDVSLINPVDRRHYSQSASWADWQHLDTGQTVIGHLRVRDGSLRRVDW